MNKIVKVVSIIGCLMLLTVLLESVLINTPLLLSEKLGRFIYFMVTNDYWRQYTFWVALVFSIVTVILFFIVLFYPKYKSTFVLKQKNGKLTLERKAIEGIVRSNLHEKEFIGSPKIKVNATKNKINVHVKGELKKTSSLVGKTNNLIQEIKEQLIQVLGARQDIRIYVTYNECHKQKSFSNDRHSRVE